MKEFKELNISVSDRSEVPLYKQIVTQVLQMAADCQIRPGDYLPTIRKLAADLRVNPSTVSRAYQELQQQGILGASRRRGTVVMGDDEIPDILSIRENRLSNIISSLLLDTLGHGYSPEELETAFALQLSEWRIRRNFEEKDRSGDNQYNNG